MGNNFFEKFDDTNKFKNNIESQLCSTRSKDVEIKKAMDKKKNKFRIVNMKIVDNAFLNNGEKSE